MLPESCKADGSATAQGGNGLGADSYFYGWDAHQISTKWAIHYAWYGRSKTGIFADAADTFAAWIKKKSNGDLGSLVNACTLDGAPRGMYSHLPNMVGSMGLSGIVSPQNQDLVDKAYQYLLTADLSLSYGWGTSTAKVRDLLVYSGNFVNFTDLNPTKPDVGPLSTRNSKLIPCLPFSAGNRSGSDPGQLRIIFSNCSR